MLSMDKSRYEGLIEQIDAYSWMKHDGIELSDCQKKHIRELRDIVLVFGGKAKKWVKLANELL